MSEHTRPVKQFKHESVRKNIISFCFAEPLAQNTIDDLYNYLSLKMRALKNIYVYKILFKTRDSNTIQIYDLTHARVTHKFDCKDRIKYATSLRNGNLFCCGDRVISGWLLDLHKNTIEHV